MNIWFHSQNTEGLSAEILTRRVEEVAVYVDRINLPTVLYAYTFEGNDGVFSRPLTIAGIPPIEFLCMPYDFISLK